MSERLVLHTRRLTLRPFRQTDAPMVREFAGAWEIADTTLGIPHPYEEGTAEKWIDSRAQAYRDGKIVDYAIVRSCDEQLLGAVTLQMEMRFDRAEFGYWVGVPFWNQGYCTEATQALVDYGFSDLGLNKITGKCLVRNPASARVLAKVGMTLEGVLRQHVKRWRGYEDVATYGILKSEWEVVRERR